MCVLQYVVIMFCDGCPSGSFFTSTGMITAHQLYNYITDHASTYGMKPLRMSKAAAATDNKKGASDLHEYALVALWNRYEHLSHTVQLVLHQLLHVNYYFLSFLCFCLVQFGLLQGSGGLAPP